MKKKPIMFQKKKGLLEHEHKVIIGIIGTHKGTGVTHSCIMLANYLKEVKGRNVALLECNDHKDFSYIQMSYEGVTHRVLGKDHFTIYGVHYYKEVEQEDLTDILNANYEYIILDLGIDLEKNVSEFLRCNIKFVISSLTEWKRHELLRFLRTTNGMNGFQSFEFLILFGDEDDMKEVREENQIKLHSIPYEPDPYLLSKESLKLFQKLR